MFGDLDWPLNASAELLVCYPVGIFQRKDSFVRSCFVTVSVWATVTFIRLLVATDMEAPVASCFHRYWQWQLLRGFRFGDKSWRLPVSMQRSEHDTEMDLMADELQLHWCDYRAVTAGNEAVCLAVIHQTVTAIILTRRGDKSSELEYVISRTAKLIFLQEG